MSDNPYYNHFGTSFGFSKSGTSAQKICNGLYTACHSFRDLGLYPRSKPIIKTPEVQTSEIEIIGKDGVFDTTESIDGTVHFFNREGVFEFSNISGRDTWDLTYEKLKRLHGRKMKIVIDEEKDGYYYGRINIDDPDYDDKKGIAYYTIVADLEPFKYDFNTTIEPWLWDPFSFTKGIIRDYSNIIITNSGNIKIYGSRIPVVPDIYVVSGNLNVTYTNMNGVQKTVSLETGSNIEKIYDLYLINDSPVVLQFSGTGTLRIEYQTGVI